MIVEASMRDLINNTEQIPTEKRHKIADEVVVISGFRVVKVGDDVIFEASTSTGHHPKIRVPITAEEHSDVTVTLPDNTQLLIAPISLANDDVYVACDCDDFFHRFAKINDRHGVLFGKIDRVYIPKGTNRQYANPIPNKPAICKHIIKLTQLLQRDRIIR